MPSTVTDLRAALAALSLDSRGNKDTLKKRLLRASKKSPSPPSQAGHVPETETTATTKRQGRRRRPHDQQFDSFLVFDVEATCERIDEPWGKFAFACVEPLPVLGPLCAMFPEPLSTRQLPERDHRVARRSPAMAEINSRKPRRPRRRQRRP